MVKNLPTSAKDLRDSGSIPGLGRIPWSRKWQPTPVFLPGKFCGQRSLAGYSPWGCRVRHNWATEHNTDINPSQLYSSPGAVIKNYELSHLKQPKFILLPFWRPWCQNWGGQSCVPSRDSGVKAFLASSSFWYLLAVLEIIIQYDLFSRFLLISTKTLFLKHSQVLKVKTYTHLFRGDHHSTWYMQAKLLQSCLTLCDPMDCSPPGSSVHDTILQARTLEWITMPSGDLPDPGIEPVSLTSIALAGGFFTTSTT